MYFAHLSSYEQYIYIFIYAIVIKQLDKNTLKNTKKIQTKQQIIINLTEYESIS